MDNGDDSQTTLAELYTSVFGRDARPRLAEARKRADRADARIARLGQGFDKRLAALKADMDDLAGRLRSVEAKAKHLSTEGKQEVVREHAVLRTEAITSQRRVLDNLISDLNALSTGLATEVGAMFANEFDDHGPPPLPDTLAQGLLAPLPGLNDVPTLSEACERLSLWLDEPAGPRESVLRLKQFTACCDLMGYLDAHGLERLQDIAAQRDEEAAVLANHLESQEGVTRRLENDLFFLEQGKVP